jgi:protease I
MAKVLLIIAPENFRDEEYFEPKQVLEEAGHEVVTSSKTLKAISTVEKKEVEVDVLFEELFTENGEPKTNDYEAIAFIGGAGAQVYIEDKHAHALAWDTYNSGKIVAAICIAPVILAKAGLLIGKRSTVWTGAKQDLCDGHCIYTPDDVVTDGRIITANGPNVATEFGNTIAKKLD